MATSWIVAADAGRALILSKAGASHVNTVRVLSNPSARRRTCDMVTDQRGRVDKKSGPIRSAMDSPINPHEQMAVVFAREICHFLEDSASRQAFDELILIAPGHFLGLLNAHLGHAATKRLVLCKAKDLIHTSRNNILRDVEQTLGKVFAPGPGQKHSPPMGG